MTISRGVVPIHECPRVNGNVTRRMRAGISTPQLVVVVQSKATRKPVSQCRQPFADSPWKRTQECLERGQGRRSVTGTRNKHRDRRLNFHQSVEMSQKM